jgi:hypothetical protein
VLAVSPRGVFSALHGVPAHWKGPEVAERSERSPQRAMRPGSSSSRRLGAADRDGGRCLGGFGACSFSAGPARRHHKALNLTEHEIHFLFIWCLSLFFLFSSFQFLKFFSFFFSFCVYLFNWRGGVRGTR